MSFNSNQKKLHLVMTAATLSAGLVACRLPGTKDSSDISAADAKNPAQIKLENQIKSFSETRAQLKAMNQKGADACEKREVLWKQIVATKQPDDQLIPPNAVFGDVLKFGNGSVHRFWRIFSGWKSEGENSDIRPFDTKQEKEDYLRLTHRYSVMAKMKFVVNPEVVKELGYTGQYASGNDCILGRLSSAVPMSVPDRMTPAFSGKFFLGGTAESQTLITQHDIGGQSSGTDYTVDPPKTKEIDNNYYSKPLSNRLSFEKGVYSGVGAFSRFLYTAQHYSKEIFGLDYTFDPRELAANHLATVTKEGSAVSNAKGPRFVWNIAPSQEVKSLFGKLGSQDADFRKHFLAMNAKMGPSKEWTVFNVYASDTWTYNPEKDAKLIGKIVTSSDFVVSDAADVRVFFKHSIQMHKVKKSNGTEMMVPAIALPNAESDPYTQDFPQAEWGDKLFTSECRLGVLAQEVIRDSESELDGSFLTGAIANPKTVRKDAKGNLCFPQILGKRLEDAITPYLKKM
jgi:hypothetical protein